MARPSRPRRGPRQPQRKANRVTSYQELPSDIVDIDHTQEEDEGTSRNLRSSDHTRKRGRPAEPTSEDESDQHSAPKHRRLTSRAQSNGLRSHPPTLTSNRAAKRARVIESESEEDSDDHKSAPKRTRLESSRAQLTASPVAEDDNSSAAPQRLRSSKRISGRARSSVPNRRRPATRARTTISPAANADSSRRTLRSSTRNSDRADYTDFISVTDSGHSSDDDYQSATKSRRVTQEARSSRPSAADVKTKTISKRSPQSTDSPSTGVEVNKNGLTLQSLPYLALCRIFTFAVMPLCNGNLQPTESLNWLLKMAQLCREFIHPCLELLYLSPPLAPRSRAHQFVQHLKADQKGMLLRYRKRVQRIQFEVSETAAHSYAGQGVIDLRALVQYSTELKDLEIYHEKDNFKDRSNNLKESIKWSYPDAMFEGLAGNWNEEVTEEDWKTGENLTKVLKYGPNILRSWRWSSRLAGYNHTLEKLEGIHKTPSFHGLQKIAFVNYRKVKLSNEEDEDSSEVKLAGAIEALPLLQHLIFESCELVNSELLSLLPGSLKTLELINCSEVDADSLKGFLVSKGSQLRELILNHNQLLSLSFLTVLASACPHLEVLMMNLIYYNKIPGMQDSNPKYKELLKVGEVPTWPSSLRIIDLQHLRKWDEAAAEVFFDSLIDSSAKLPDLRQLIVKATLPRESYKTRAKFRGRLARTFDEVFLSRRPDPNPTWISIQAIQDQIKAAEKGAEEIEAPATGTGAIAEGGKDVEHVFIRGSSRKTRSQKEGEEQDADLEADLEVEEGPAALRSSRSKRSQVPAKPQPSSKRKRASYEDPAPELLERKKRRTRASVNYTEENSDESEDEVAGATIPDDITGQLASPPGSNSDYAQSENEDENAPQSRPARRLNRLEREIAGLHATSGQGNFLSSPPPSGPDSGDSEDEPLISQAERKKAHVERFVQGMCDVVVISIDNIRARDEPMVEADFVDAENDDPDWNGEDLEPEYGYASN